MTQRPRILLLFLALLVAGCATPAKQASMVPNSLAEISLNQKYKATIAVGNVVGGKKTNPLWVSNISNEAFRSSLVSALRNKGYLNESGPNRLEVNLKSVKQPLVGIDLKVTTSVLYTMKSATGQTLFERTITAPYTAKFSDSLLAVERLRLANEGSARENIKQFLIELERG